MKHPRVRRAAVRRPGHATIALARPARSLVADHTAR